MQLLMFGPPGAGKGTQAEFIARHYAIPHISTGDIFRENIRTGTALGKEAQRYTEAGELVPDSVTNAMIRDRLSHEDCLGGFLLDGYPRTLEQAKELDNILAGLNETIDAVVNLAVPDDEVAERLLKRGRSDDTQETVRRRLEIYHETTRPLEMYYAEKGKLLNVDGIGSIEEITRHIVEAITRHSAAQHA
jgi:adenylate kinase